MNPRVVLTLVAIGGLNLCSSVSCAKQPIAAPCGLTGLSWHMTEAELKAARPNAYYDNSTFHYHEGVPECMPYVERVTYAVSWWRGLTGIEMHREWPESAPEFQPLVPGFLLGCKQMWGEPEGVEIFARPKSPKVQVLWNVGMWWHPSWGTIYAYHSSPNSLRKVPTFAVWITLPSADSDIRSFRRWAKPDSSREAVAAHFQGFPTEAQVSGPVFH